MNYSGGDRAGSGKGHIDGFTVSYADACSRIFQVGKCALLSTWIRRLEIYRLLGYFSSRLSQCVHGEIIYAICGGRRMVGSDCIVQTAVIRSVSDVIIMNYL